MKQETRDHLVDCLERMLTSVTADQDPEIFVDMVTEEYLMSLVREAHIPLRYLSSLRDDVRTEITDLLRVRAYSYPSLQEYFVSQAEQIRRAV